jgi:hypothetical protein
MSIFAAIALVLACAVLGSRRFVFTHRDRRAHHRPPDPEELNGSARAAVGGLSNAHLPHALEASAPLCDPYSLVHSSRACTAALSVIGPWPAIWSVALIAESWAKH